MTFPGASSVFVFSGLSYYYVCRYGELWTGRLSFKASLNRCFAILMQPRRPSQMSQNRTVTKWTHLFRLGTHRGPEFSIQNLRQILFCFLISFLRLFICWSMSISGWCWARLRLSSRGMDEVYGEMSLRLLCLIGDGESGDVVTRKGFARESESPVGLSGIMSNSQLSNPSLRPIAGVNACVRPH